MEFLKYIIIWDNRYVIQIKLKRTEIFKGKWIKCKEVD
jgi:hypothetical protein